MNIGMKIEASSKTSVKPNCQTHIKTRPISLERFQDLFAQALTNSGADAAAALQVAHLVQQPGFAVYRNTVMKGAIDALQANYPTVTRLVGEPWLRSAASIYVQRYPPQDTRLLQYGEQFPAFLESFAPAAELTYLAGVARLDRFWTEAHVAADETPMDATMLSALRPEQLAATVLRPHAAARWQWFPEQPVYAIWQRNRDPLQQTGDIAWHGDGGLLVRPHQEVKWMALDAAGCAFLDACRAGRPLTDAANAALAVQADADLSAMLASLLTVGAFSSSAPLAATSPRPLTIPRKETS